MPLYTSGNLSGAGTLWDGTQFDAGQLGDFVFNVTNSPAVKNLSGSAYFTMERQTNSNGEYDCEPLSGTFVALGSGNSIDDEDLGFIQNTYRWSVNVGNEENTPRIRFIPDFDITDFPVILRATGGINVNVSISNP